MSCVSTISDCVTQGDDWYVDVTITEDGAFTNGVPDNPEDLTGATLTFAFYDSLGGSLVETPTSTITNATLGQISISMTDVQTEALITTETSRTIYGQLLITHADGTKRTYFTLALEVHRSYN